MRDTAIRFNDGATYEHYMGVWSRLVADPFLDWLAPATAQRWLDVGCGNGAFTELIYARCAPCSVHGVDPSPEQLAHARGRTALREAVFDQGDAMALPYANDAFDIAVMPLVIFFVPEPERGVVEMLRVVSPGGLVAAYAWDMPGGGFPYHALMSELRAMGKVIPAPPSAGISRIEALHALWEEAGVAQVESREICVERHFSSFDAYWNIASKAPSVGHLLTELDAAETAHVQTTLRACLPESPDGSIRCQARANAVKGMVPKR